MLGSTTSVHPVVEAFLSQHGQELVAFRRHLHANPELSGEEHATTASVAERLLVAGLDPRLLSAGTGLVCDVGPGGGRVVALRADLDALAMQDEKVVPYRSRVDGVAHACGHDVHTAVVLGAGLLLDELLRVPGAPAGSVRLIFEPGEEQVPGGAVDVIAEGNLDDVDAIFGLHCDPKLAAGRLGLRAGPLTSAADQLDVRLHGPGGHTARPELTVDLVNVAALVATALPPRLAAAAERLGDLRLVWGSLRTGAAANVIPARATLRGSLRTPDRVAWDAAPDLVLDAVATLLEGSGAEWRVDHVRGVPPVVNDAAATATMAAAVRAAIGADAVVPAEQSWGGDSFAWYLDQVPGCYARLGVADPARTEPPLDLHASTFDVDESAILVGVRALVATVMSCLADDGSTRVGASA